MSFPQEKSGCRRAICCNAGRNAASATSTRRAKRGLTEKPRVRKEHPLTTSRENRLNRLKDAHRALLAERWAWFICGVVVNAFGIALITKAALGTSPISSLPYVLSLEFPLSLGLFSFFLNMVFIVMQAVLLGRDFPASQWLQVLVNAIFSASIDVGMALLSWLQVSSLPEAVISLAIGIVVLGAGITVEVAPDVMYVPGEGVVAAISKRSGKVLGSCKIVFDCTLVAIAVVLSFTFFGYLNGVGVGTVASALLVGTVVMFTHKHLPIVRRIENARDVDLHLSRLIKRYARHEKLRAKSAPEASRASETRQTPVAES